MVLQGTRRTLFCWSYFGKVVVSLARSRWEEAFIMVIRSDLVPCIC